MLRFSLSLWLCLIGTSLPLLAQTETPAANPLETPLKSSKVIKLLTELDEKEALKII